MVLVLLRFSLHEFTWLALIIQITYFAFHKHGDTFYQGSVYLPCQHLPEYQHRLTTNTLASWHPCLFSCQPGGSPPGSSRPSILIIFQQTDQFVGPNPLQHKGHNGSYSGPLSSTDLLLPSSLPHFLIEESAWTDRF